MELTGWQLLRIQAYLFLVGMLRRVTLGVRVMLVEGDSVLLIRHTYTPGWQFPGGGVEPGESAEQGAAREVLEETGYRVLGRPALFALYHNVQRATIRDHLAFYVCRTHERAVAFAPDQEIAEAGWFARDAVPADTTPGTLRRIAEVFEGRVPEARW